MLKKRENKKGGKSASVRRKISRGMKEYYKTHSSHRKGRHFSRKQRERLSRLKKEYLKKHPSWRERKSRQMKEYCRKNPGLIKRMTKKSLEYFRKNPRAVKERIEAVRKAYKHPQLLDKISKIRRNPEIRKKISRTMKLRYVLNPALREEASRKAKEVFKEHPSLRKEARKRFFEKVINNPEFLKKMRHSKGNPNPLDVRTLKGGKVRSTYEKKVADVLFTHKIRYSYEIQALVFEKEKKWTIPDFWLPDYNCIIEVYGGYPGSRSKTIWKNRIYRKHGLLFIGITPSETRNLKKHLLDELKKVGRNPRLCRKALSVLSPLPGA